MRNKLCVHLLPVGAAVLENGAQRGSIHPGWSCSDEVKKRLHESPTIRVKRINFGDENLTVSLVYLNILQESSGDALVARPHDY